MWKVKRRQKSEKKVGNGWLDEPVKRVMYCADCRKYAGEKMRGISFVVGTNKYKIEKLKDRENSNCQSQVLMQIQCQ